MALLLRGAHVVDPIANIDEQADILVRDGVVVEVATGKGTISKPDKCVERDLTGTILIPGMIDSHVHLRDPGFEYKETVLTGMKAAAKGGFCGVCAMANTSPVIDNAAMVERELEKCSYAPGKTRVYPIGACTKGLAGKTLSEMADMAAAGAVAFSDDGHGIQNPAIARACMEYAFMLKKPVLNHCQDDALSANGVINEGKASSRLGLSAWPATAEEIHIARDIELCRLTGCHVHIQHITTAHGVELVARAKKEGLPITCEVTPHHLFLCEDMISRKSYSANLKMNPPLRTYEDCLALQNALIDGIIDIVATDHAPHAPHEKDIEFSQAAFGTIGLETALGLLLSGLVLEKGALKFGGAQGGAKLEGAEQGDVMGAGSADGAGEGAELAGEGAELAGEDGEHPSTSGEHTGVDAQGGAGEHTGVDAQGCAGEHTGVPQIEKRMSWQRFVEVFCIAPRKLFNLPQITIKPGSVADYTVIDPHEKWTVTADDFESKSKNSAFLGMQLQGRAKDVYTQGYASLQDGKVMF